MPEPQSELTSTRNDALSTRLFVVVCLIVVFIATVLLSGLLVQWRAYSEGIKAAVSGMNDGIAANVDHAAIITYARGLGAAVNKTSALFLGFMLIFTGALYVLRHSAVAYSLTANSGKMSGALATTSPGLVIVTLGIILTIATIMTKSDIDYEGPASNPVAPESTHRGKEATPIPSEPNTPMKPVEPEAGK